MVHATARERLLDCFRRWKSDSSSLSLLTLRLSAVSDFLSLSQGESVIHKLLSH